MKVIKETIGNAEVYIQTLDETLDIVGVTGTERKTQVTSFNADLRAAYTKIRSVVRDIAADFGSELKNIGTQVSPSEVAMEFSLGLSSEGKILWLVSGKGEFGFKVNITWDLSGNENPAKTKR
ncbi:MAG: hypothetical protein M3R69_08760 [Acidobacteriota bacterium]|nr:hypothetical protein [Acidobacteriota bacterium]